MEKARIAKKGPYVMDMDPGTNFWCTCGKSSKQPFCDGSHVGTSFVPKKVVIAEAKKVAWCGCKQSKIGAFCDGTHAEL
jgi:CDGSH-type Zn-finger protein